ncbi:MAG: EutN/CcmL family microcompartment protein [bacterium]|nr:EutN/CcmL family microcompartment protein [bacterium]
MILARVKGQAVASAKVDNLQGYKLLLVELLSLNTDGLIFTRKHMVVLDPVGAGEGDLVLVVQGSSARQAADMRQVPVDALIVGIVASVTALGQHVTAEALAA